MKRDDGGSAFPWPMTAGAESDVTHDAGNSGMSLRDFFAAAVLPTLAVGMYSVTGTAEECEEKVARAAYAVADAMLRERNRKDTPS